jgi:hypothetical protein
MKTATKTAPKTSKTAPVVKKSPVTIKWGKKEDNIQFVIATNLELHWAKLDPKHPVEPFGTLQWEIQARFPKSAVAEMEQFGTVKQCKDNDKLYQINFKKKAVKADGTPAKPIAVVDNEGEDINPVTLGNGSKGDIKLMLRDYTITGPKGKVTKEGTAVTLSSIRVTDHKVYEPRNSGFDFDEDEDADGDSDADESDDDEDEDDDL